jgi:hypothetical protein
MGTAQISDPEAIFHYVMAGRATLTLVSRTTGLRFTFQVSPKLVRLVDGEDTGKFAARVREAMDGVRFVKVLTGADNTRDYTYIGHINAERRFRTDNRTALDPNTPSVRAWAWFWDVLMRRLPKLNQLEVWHHGKCSRCGRRLTVPESLSTGLGPVCAEEAYGAFHGGTPTHTTSSARVAALALKPRGVLSFHTATSEAAR